MLLEHGSMDYVDTLVQKWAKEEEEERLDGGWHTAVSLGNMNWTELLNLNGFFWTKPLYSLNASIS